MVDLKLTLIYYYVNKFGYSIFYANTITILYLLYCNSLVVLKFKLTFSFLVLNIFLSITKIKANNTSYT